MYHPTILPIIAKRSTSLPEWARLTVHRRRQVTRRAELGACHCCSKSNLAVRSLGPGHISDPNALFAQRCRSNTTTIIHQHPNVFFASRSTQQLSEYAITFEFGYVRRSHKCYLLILNISNFENWCFYRWWRTVCRQSHSLLSLTCRLHYYVLKS